MPTKTREAGDRTLYDEVGKLDEDLPEGPGYSENKGCRSEAITMALMILCLLLVS